MGFRGRLLLFGYPALEILTAWGLASVIGWGWTMLLVLGGLPFGLLLMRTAGREAVSQARMNQSRIAEDPGMLPSIAARPAARFAAGVLLAIPGLWSDLVAIAVLVPATRRWLLGRLGTASTGAWGTWSWRWGTMSAGTPGESVRGESFGANVVRGSVIKREGDQNGEGPSEMDGPSPDSTMGRN